ncbi:MAG: hypothetical protein FJW69_06505 [Actinobacteria bacterium]|nr:hypothetical protein [Actinomycetota bacterium]MBM3712278.1 hypothetical protein [Actinomycetota bacterium]
MQTTKFKKLTAAFLTITSTTAIFLCTCLITCGKPELTFGQIVISEDIEKDTNLPINHRTEFEVTSKQIYATIKYEGAKGSDSWQFKWYNMDLEEIILDSINKYNESQPNAYFKGIIASNILKTDEAKIFQPGIYKVDYYHNDELKQSAGFEVARPQISIIEVSTASEIDIKGAPVIKTQQFNLNQIVYICVKLDYLVSGNSIKVLWKKADDSLIDEEKTELISDYYEPSYIWFNLNLEKFMETVEPGRYKVEIYLNDNLYTTSYFDLII